jgi:hypothetical protein
MPAATIKSRQRLAELGEDIAELRGRHVREARELDRRVAKAIADARTLSIPVREIADLLGLRHRQEVYDRLEVNGDK